MGSQLEEEKILLLEQQPHPKSKKGGHIAIPFIIVNEAFERLASTGLSPNMVIYLMNEYHLELATISVITSLFSALSNGLAIFGALIADSYLGRFRTISLGSISMALGMTLLWLTTMIPQLRPLPCGNQLISNICDSPTAGQMLVLFSYFGLNSLGAACIRPCSMAFGADQVAIKDRYHSNNIYNRRALESFFNWYNACISFSAIIALTIVVYIQDHMGWKVGFGVPAVFMVSSALIFLVGSSFYIKLKASKSLLTGLVQVSVAAFRKRNISLPPSSNPTSSSSCDCFHQLRCYPEPEPEPKTVAPTSNMRCLNKACIITDPDRELNPDDGSASDPWSLCTVEQVESLKDFAKVIPMWSTGIILQLTITGNTFTTPQAKTVDRHITSRFEIPAGSFVTFMVIALLIWIPVYEGVLVRLLAKITGNQRGLSPVTRMGIGIVLASAAMATSAYVESVRRGMAIEQGFEDDPNGVVDMSWLLLLPQYVLLGVADAITTTGQCEFFYTQLPKGMSSIAIALYTLQMSASSLVSSLLVSVVNSVTSGGGRISWVSSNLNKGHVDYYYWLLAFLGLLNFVYFLFCRRVYKRSAAETTSSSWAVDEDVKEGESH